MITPLDERRHAAGPDQRWVEAWLFDVVQANGSVAMSIEFMLWPQLNRVAFHASVVRPRQPLVSLVELDATAPKGQSLEVRAPGLWTDIGIQTPLDHMTVDIEAFAVALDEPTDVFDGAYGIRTALGCELEWETDGAEPMIAAEDSYALPCIVHGELLLDEQTIEIDGWGWRSHRWGVPTTTDRAPLRGRTATGEWVHDNNEDRAVTMAVVGEAPVPEPAIDAQLWQYFASSSEADHAWIRRVIESS